MLPLVDCGEHQRLHQTLDISQQWLWGRLQPTRPTRSDWVSPFGPRWMDAAGRIVDDCGRIISQELEQCLCPQSIEFWVTTTSVSAVQGQQCAASCWLEPGAAGSGTGVPDAPPIASRKRWRDHVSPGDRILQGTGSELTPVKVVRKKLRESWLSTAVVVHKREWTSCSCYYFARRGHCSHHYSILVRLGLGLLQLKTKLPQNPRSDMKDADGSSAEDASPKRKKKRHRPCYRPMPAPVLPTSASPRPEPSPGKVLKPQKIAKFPFNRWKLSSKTSDLMSSMKETSSLWAYFSLEALG